MIRVNNIEIPLEFNFDNISEYIINKYKLNKNEIENITLSKKSVDARKKNNIHFVISIDIEAKNERSILKKIKNSTIIEKYNYRINKINTVNKRPVVVGFGPAGIFVSLILAESEAKPIILERGGNVDERQSAVEKFWETGELNENCNVQFGEGGAGTFSDGKLTTGINDKRIKYILEVLVKFGAPKEILYLSKPHIGTDKLRLVVKNIRDYIISLGGEVKFNCKFTDFEIKDNSISKIEYESGCNKYQIETDNLILAVGHSARDVFKMLYDKNINLSQKNFSMGLRIEHLRKDINKAMYGEYADNKALKSADYKLAVHLKNGRSVYTFCMCPGGVVVAAASEKNKLTVNGMSYYSRDEENSNSALLVGISPSDFNSEHPLAGMYLQQQIEEKAYIAGGSNYNAPITTVKDFLNDTLPAKLGKVKPSYKPGVTFAQPQQYLPDYICDSLKIGIKEFGKKIKGFDCDDAILTGIESRSSSPIRIDRNEEYQSITVQGLYPCGEGAGYAGGIMSAAADGIKCAEKIIERLRSEQIES